MIEVVGLASNGREAIELAQQTKPDVILMDINMPDMDGIVATETIRRKIPYSQIVILSVQNDSSYMRRAMLAGARDFLAKPPSTDELTKAIRQAGAMAREEQAKGYQGLAGGTSASAHQALAKILGKIIVVYSPKGGAGCTTVATNLAVCLQTPETKAALIDGSLQFGDVAVFLNEHVKNSVLDLTSRVEELDPEIVEDVMINHAATGLHVLPAPLHPEHAIDVTSEQFSKLLEYLKRIYAYVVVDTTSYLTEIVQSALEVADLIILVTTQDIPSIKSTSAFLTLADASGIKRNRIIFVMNRYDRRIGISPEKVGESLRQEILVSIPLDDTGQLNNSLIRGIPLVIQQKINLVSKSIFSLCDLVRNRLNKLENLQETVAKK
jgi:pilus assembly protein CpaE